MVTVAKTFRHRHTKILMGGGEDTYVIRDNLVHVHVCNNPSTCTGNGNTFNHIIDSYKCFKRVLTSISSLCSLKESINYWSDDALLSIYGCAVV